MKGKREGWIIFSMMFVFTIIGYWAGTKCALEDVIYTFIAAFILMVISTFYPRRKQNKERKKNE